MHSRHFLISQIGLIVTLASLLFFSPFPSVAQGISLQSISTKTITLVPVYRFYRYLEQVHMYDTKLDGHPGWASEGIAFYVSPIQLPYLVPLYGVRGGYNFDSFYTIDLGARNYCITTLGYKDLGVLGYVLQPDSDFSATAPLTRWVRVHGLKGVSLQDHFYYTSTSPVKDYGYEGIACRVWTDPVKLPNKLLELSAPVSGTILRVNDSPAITWKLWSSGGFIRILYSTDNGLSWQPITTVANTGMFAEVNNQTYSNWKIPANAVGKIKIRVDWMAFPDFGTKLPWASDTSGPLTVMNPRIRILPRQ